MVDHKLPDSFSRSSISDKPIKLLISTAILLEPFSAARSRSAPRSTYISLTPHFKRSGSCVIVHPSLINACFTSTWYLSRAGMAPAFRGKCSSDCKIETALTLVMASHDPSVDQYADLVYRMQDGQIVDRTELS